MSARPYARFATIGVFALPLIVSGLAQADIPEVLACADKADNGERLTCYDAAAAKLKKQIKDEETKRTTMFGFPLPFLDSDDSPSAPKLGPKPVNQVDAKIMDIGADQVGHETVILDNGQVWQVDTGKRVPRPEGSETRAQIVRNLLGGFYLSVDDQHNNIPVHRIK